MLDMYKKPIIGIIARPDTASDEDRVLCVEEHYRQAIIKKGGIPILILPNQDVIYETTKPKEVPRLTESEKEDFIRVINMCDGLLMQGGYKWYEYDEFICNYAIDNDIPILGICLGMQLMGKIDCNKNDVALDTTVKNETNINHRQSGVKYAHKVNICENSVLKKIIGKDIIEVNSSHNYHIEKTNMFSISAYSEDNLIEAIELKSKRFVLGVQWHPEKMIDYDENANKIFDTFIEKAKNKNIKKLI